MKQTLVAFVAGLVFATGLGISGMTQPAKVIGFLDFFSVSRPWDPSLMFVMAGAIGAHFYFARRAVAIGAPRFALPTRTDVDSRLIVGAAVFGVGWGIAGLCPGPAIVGVVAGTPTTIAFVVAMAVARFAYRYVVAARGISDAPDETCGAQPGLPSTRGATSTGR